VKIPLQAINLIKKYESFSEVAYKCSSNVWTIGYGTTIYSNNQKVKQFDKITKEEAEKELYNYCKKYCVDIIKKIEKNRNKKLSTNQISALISLIYNIGLCNFKKSKCFQYLCKNEDNNAMKNWNWIEANGEILDGLIKRREEEIKLFFL